MPTIFNKFSNYGLASTRPKQLETQTKIKIYKYKISDTKGHNEIIPVGTMEIVCLEYTLILAHSLSREQFSVTQDTGDIQGQNTLEKHHIELTIHLWINRLISNVQQTYILMIINCVARNFKYKLTNQPTGHYNQYIIDKDLQYCVTMSIQTREQERVNKNTTDKYCQTNPVFCCFFYFWWGMNSHTVKRV